MIEYPISLPGPVSAPIQSAERRVLSAIPGPRESRAFMRERMAGQEVEFVFNYEQAQVFSAWVKDELIEGGAWFSASWPQPQGGIGVRRFIGAPAYPRYIPNLGWYVSAQCVVLDASEFACIPWVQLGECATPGVPVVFGSGTRLVRDPATGYVWSLWTSDGGFTMPQGGSGSYSGTYALVYDPIAMTLLDAIRLGDANEPYSIVLIEGVIYVGVYGSSFTAGIDIVTKIDAATRVILGSGDTDYLGAVSVLGLLSHDKTRLFMSVVNGVGAGTSPLSNSPPFAFGTPAESASNWLFNSVFNPFSNVRAYVGFGSFIELRGAVTRTLSTTGKIIAASTLQSSRLLDRPCSAHVFLANVGFRGVLRVNTLSGGIQIVDSTLLPRAIYYSPESGRLYIDGRTDALLPSTVRVYDGSSLALLTELPSYAISEGTQIGGTAYLGCEAFVGCEIGGAYGSRLWRVGFPT